MFNYKNTQIKVSLGDITKVQADGIVNAANNTLLGGGGVDGAIHRAGGKLILDQCKKIGGCPTGEARITVAGMLDADYVIHTVGPIYTGGKSGEEKLLYNAYYNSLKLAKEYNLKSLAFPSISTGAYGYPIEEAVVVVLKAIKDFINKEDFPNTINFVLFSEDDYNLYKTYLSQEL